jgi:polysaccharide export outer membrane protein
MWTYKRLVATVFVLSAVSSVFAAEPMLTAALEPDKPQDVTKAQDTNDYRIGPEDVLDISVWNNTAISRTVPVRPDGKISLPLLNDVQAEGLTPMQLRSVLMKKLKEYLPAPEVSIIVREVHSFKVSVIGEVKKTGRHELRGRTTVLDVLALAEGFGEFAARRKIVILRPAGELMTQIPFNYNGVLDNGGTNFYLQPGDIIVVP